MARVNMRKNDIILALAGGGDTDLHSHRFHRFCGKETPAFRRGEELPLPSILS